jgi:hypothetical protein
MKKMIAGGLTVLAVAGLAGVAGAVPGDESGDPYVAPSYGSERNIERATETEAAPDEQEQPYVLADVPQEKFVSPAGVLRAGTTPNGDMALTFAAYHEELDGVCTRVGASLDGSPNEQIAQALDQAVTDVEALATPSDQVEFQAELVALAERQADLIRSLADGQAADADALGAELEQVEVEIEDLFVKQGGFEVCGQA